MPCAIEAEKGDRAVTPFTAGGIHFALTRSDSPRSPSMTRMSTEWFVVRSKPRKEDFAVQSLGRRGVVAFCPRILEPVGMTNDWATVPLFPGYLFVHIELHSGFHTVMWTPGVKGFVSFGEMPTSVQPEIVNF